MSESELKTSDLILTVKALSPELRLGVWSPDPGEVAEGEVAGARAGAGEGEEAEAGEGVEGDVSEEEDIAQVKEPPTPRILTRRRNKERNRKKKKKKKKKENQKEEKEEEKEKEEDRTRSSSFGDTEFSFV